MAPRQKLSEPLIVSFSGLDGSGKTTQISELRESITQLGMRAELITFWDDVVVGTRYREGFVHKVFGSERGVGAPGHPVERRDKNVQVGYLTVVRHLLYLADAIHLRMVLNRRRQSGADVIIMDRYLFDQLTNLPLNNPISAAYARLLAAIAPRPDLALLVDADPDLARARKPEYSLTFMRQSRRSYFRLAQLLGYITIIPPLTIADARSAILANFLRRLGERENQSGFAGAAPAA
jgi:thymidylate kinase